MLYEIFKLMVTDTNSVEESLIPIWLRATGNNGKHRRPEKSSLCYCKIWSTGHPVDVGEGVQAGLAILYGVDPWRIVKSYRRPKIRLHVHSPESSFH